MPGSPESRITCPAPDFACIQRSTISSISSSRPTSGVRAEAECSASNRLSIVLSPRTRHARTGSTKPFSSTIPSSSYSKIPLVSLCVFASITTLSGSAKVCSRAARFGVSPTTPRSWDSPAPTRSPTTTRPVAIPTRTGSLPPGAAGTGRAIVTICRPARTARSASSSCACG